MDASPPAPHVLVVDDDAGIRTMLELALGSRGFRVTPISGRAEGWSETPDVVLLDLRLRDETAAEFLASGAVPRETPVILLTANAGGTRAGRGLPVAATLAKPFDLDVLFETIRRVLGPSAE